MKKILLTLFLISTVLSCTQDVGDVPKELFGIKLGTIYDFSKVTKGDVGKFPIKNFTGANQFLGSGTHFYFEPLVESKYFPYKEKKKNKDDEYYETNYRLYLLPVIPDSIKTIEELTSSKLEMEVTVIQWSDNKKNKEESYFWTMEMCKTFSSDIKIKPEILDNYEKKYYFCKFKKDNRMLEINNLTDSVYFTLQYDKEFLDKKSEEVDEKVRKLKAKDILKK
jgi:hypothetical protein